jgi:tetratricopeptide (TPR) repeat protein
VANALDTVLDLDPDLILVYTGHNEMLEGHLDVLSSLSWPHRLRAALLSTSSLFAWMNHGLTSLLWPEEAQIRAERWAALRAGQIPTYEPRAVPEEQRTIPEPAFFEAAAEGYEGNLGAMTQKTTDAGVPILFLLPVANLLFPPSISAHGAGFEREGEFEESVEAARLSMRDGRVGAGLKHLDRAVALSPRYAMVHYLRASGLRAADRTQAALAAYRRALDLDVRTHRMTSQLESTFIETLDGQGASWVDLRPVFWTSLDEETAEALFVDHLHPTALGHERIADAVMPQVIELLQIKAFNSSAP